jgi:hypothetical protein
MLFEDHGSRDHGNAFGRVAQHERAHADSCTRQTKHYY